MGDYSTITHLEWPKSQMESVQFLHRDEPGGQLYPVDGEVRIDARRTFTGPEYNGPFRHHAAVT